MTIWKQLDNLGIAHKPTQYPIGGAPLQRPLDPSLVYASCPLCEANGTMNSPLTRDSVGAIKCQFGHVPRADQILALDSNTSGLVQPDTTMTKLVDMQLEQPAITDIRWPIYVNPKVKEKLEVKLKGRLWRTIGTLLAAIADDSLVIITGDEARQLKKHGLNSGKQILEYIASTKDVEKDRDEAVSQVMRFMKMMQSAAADDK